MQVLGPSETFVRVMKQVNPKDALTAGTAQVLRGVGFKDEDARVAYESWAAVKTVERVQVCSILVNFS